jgi:hypothetical protein
MTDRSSEASVALGNVLWPDAAIERLTVDYDTVVLRIREATGTVKRVRCEGHIGLSLNGFWDEVIIEGADVLTSHPAIDRAVASITQRLGDTWLDSGNEERNTRRWAVLVARLSDGCTLEVVAAKFAVE